MSLPWRKRRQDQQARQSSAWGQSVRGPERAYYQRLAGDYSQVSRNGKLTLTATHVLFTSVIGADAAVPLQDVHEVRNQKIRRFHVGGHDSQLVIATRSGEIGFLVADPAAWAGAIRDRLPAAERLPPRSPPIPDTTQFAPADLSPTRRGLGVAAGGAGMGGCATLSQRSQVARMRRMAMRAEPTVSIRALEPALEELDHCLHGGCGNSRRCVRQHAKLGVLQGAVGGDSFFY